MVVEDQNRTGSNLLECEAAINLPRLLLLLLLLLLGNVVVLRNMTIFKILSQKHDIALP